LRVTRANHLGGLLTRSTPRPAPLRDALVQQAAARAAQTETSQPQPRRQEEGDQPLNDLQKSILAATHKLRRDGHPPDAP
jgi:hypothetical protein